MHYVIGVFGAAVGLLGLTSVAVPSTLRRLIRSWSSQGRFVVAILTRLVIGAILIYAADATRFPVIIKMLGGISVAAAVVIAVMGRSTLDRMVDWWMAKSDTILRVSAFFAALFGAFLVYAVT